MPELGQNTSGNTKRPWLNKPWPKGVSGNPGGRPKKAVLRALLEPHRRSMVATLLQLMRHADKDATRLEAVKVMLAYLDGKPDGITLESLSDEELLALAMTRVKQNNPQQAEQ